MSMNMYAVAGDCPSNEELALRIQNGNGKAAELLLSQNEGYITDLALKYIEWCDLDDLKREGGLALLEAAKRFDPSHGIKLLTYATPAMESAMMDYGSHDSLTISILPGRYHQLRKVAFVCAEAQDESEPALITAVCKELEVSPKVAAELLKEYRTLFNIRLLGDDVFSISCGGDQARAHDRYMRRVLLLKLMEDVLKARELNLVPTVSGSPSRKPFTEPERKQRSTPATICHLKPCGLMRRIWRSGSSVRSLHRSVSTRYSATHWKTKKNKQYGTGLRPLPYCFYFAPSASDMERGSDLFATQ